MKRFTIVISANNAGQKIISCVEDIKKGTYDLKRVELIIVNNGSIDSTRKAVDALKKANPSLTIKLIDKNNCGVSSVKNIATKTAEGEFILFVDYEDRLAHNCLEKLDAFIRENNVFLTVINEKNTIRSTKGYWKGCFNGSGIYDINEFCYGAVTAVNYCLKNCKDNNLLFDEQFLIYEIEDHFARNALSVGKYGYCEEAVYVRNDKNGKELAAGSYCFPQSMEFYHRIIKISKERYGFVCEYAQALIVNDLSSKLRGNYFQSEPNDFWQKQKDQIKTILAYIKPSLLLEHPQVDKFHKHFFLKLSGMIPQIYFSGQKIMFELDGYKEQVKQNELYISAIKVRNGKIRISGFYKTFLTEYVDHKDVRVYALIGNQMIECVQRYTYFSHHRSKIETNNFIGWDIEVGYDFTTLAFFVSVYGRLYKVNRFSFKDYRDNKDLKINLGDYSLSFDKKEGRFSLSSIAIFDYVKNKDWKLIPSFLVAISICLRKIKRINIYNDREGVFGNSFVQFIKDYKKNDGVDRYYVCFSISDKRTLMEKHNIKEDALLDYRSIKHQILFLASRQIFTSIVDAAIYQPIKPARYKNFYAEMSLREIIFMQRDVCRTKKLHYAAEFLDIDKVVISSVREGIYFKELGFIDSQLIKTWS